MAAVSLNRGEVRRLASAPAGWRPGWDLAGTVVAAAADGSGPSGRAAGRRPAPRGRLGRAGGRAHPHAGHRSPTGWPSPPPPPSRWPGLTAYRTLQQADVIEGRRVLVTGASGGVGRFAIQIASHWGAEVTAVVGRPDRADGLEGLGATDVSVGMPDDGPFDIILESVGGESLARALELVAPQRHRRRLRQLVGRAHDLRRDPALPEARRPPAGLPHLLRARSADLHHPRPRRPGGAACATATSTPRSTSSCRGPKPPPPSTSCSARRVDGKAVLRVGRDP